jgi:hypothetical protein
VIEFGVTGLDPPKQQQQAEHVPVPDRVDPKRTPFKFTASSDLPHPARRFRFLRSLSTLTSGALKATENRKRNAARKKQKKPPRQRQQKPRVEYVAVHHPPPDTPEQQQAKEQRLPQLKQNAAEAKALLRTARKQLRPLDRNLRQLLRADGVAKKLKAARSVLAAFEAAADRDPILRTPKTQRGERANDEKLIKEQRALRKERRALKKKVKSLHVEFLTIHQRVKWAVRDFHHKVALYLCQNYRVIIIPRFGAKQMCAKGNRRLRRSTKRSMLACAHGKFLVRLKEVAKRFEWVKVIVCDEIFTSKTCSQCFAIHEDLGSNKVFRCPAEGCGYVVRILFLFVCFGVDEFSFFFPRLPGYHHSFLKVALC